MPFIAIISVGCKIEAFFTRACRFESTHFKSGRICLCRTIHVHHFSEAELKRIIDNPEILRSQIEVNKSIPSHIVEECEIFFDHGKKLLLIERKLNTNISICKVLYTPKFVRTYVKLRMKSPHKVQIITNKPTSLLYWPLELLVGTFFSSEWRAARKGGKIEIITYNPSTKELLIKGWRRYWINLKHGYMVTRLQTFDPKGRLNLDSFVSYFRSQDFWYPKKIYEIYYVYDKKGRRYISRFEVTEIKKARLNIEIPEKKFTIKFPYGAFVQDNRFDPPLVFIQGRKQFTDEELFQISKNRELIHKPEWGWFSYPSASFGGYALAIIGFILALLSTYMKRKNFKPKRVTKKG